MNNSKPVVGVTGPDRGGTAAWLFTRLAIWLQGGKALRITPAHTRSDQSFDALILGGGADVHPLNYGHNLEEEYKDEIRKSHSLKKWLLRCLSLLFFPIVFLTRKLFSVSNPDIDRKRDQLELELLTQAIEKKKPVLGICRGAQLINIKFGGTLHRDLEGFYGEVPRPHTIFPKKKVIVDRSSKLGSVLSKSEIMVNALHHQAVGQLGKSLKAVAREENGIIQAVEQPEYSFLIGVQWHPEYMPQIERQRKIFRELVESSRQGAVGSKLAKSAIFFILCPLLYALCPFRN